MTTRTNALPHSGSIARVVLDNGITVLVYENFAAQSVVLAGSLAVGSLNETPHKNGLAALTTSALMRGTHARDFDAIHTTLEDIGADLGFSAGVHKTRFYGKALAEDLPTLVDLLGEALRTPAFPTTQVERLRGEILTGLRIREQDSRARAGRAFREALYAPDHPYFYSPRGTLDTVPTLTVDDLAAFHAQSFGPNGMIVVIVGAVEAQAAVATVRERLADWQNPDQPAAVILPPVQPPTETVRSAVTLPGKTQTDLVVGVIGPSRYAADYQAATLANSVLGQFGMMGRIGAVVREKQGLAYYAYSRIEGGHGPGAWNIAIGVNPKNVARAVESALGEVRRMIDEAISDDDLLDNQSYFTGRLPLTLENNEGIAGAILTMESFDLSLDYLLGYREAIFSLTKADLQTALAHYWTPDAYVLATAGPNGAAG